MQLPDILFFGLKMRHYHLVSKERKKKRFPSHNPRSRILDGFAPIWALPAIRCRNKEEGPTIAMLPTTPMPTFTPHTRTKRKYKIVVHHRGIWKVGPAAHTELSLWGWLGMKCRAILHSIGSFLRGSKLLFIYAVLPVAACGCPSVNLIRFWLDIEIHDPCVYLYMHAV